MALRLLEQLIVLGVRDDWLVVVIFEPTPGRRGEWRLLPWQPRQFCSFFCLFSPF
jgi:hypothetical protein